MYSNRLKKAMFDYRILGAEGLTKGLVYSMLEQLPQDAKIVGFGNDLTKACSYWIIESNSFEEVSEGYDIPELIFNFYRNVDGISVCNGYELIPTKKNLLKN